MIAARWTIGGAVAFLSACAPTFVHEHRATPKLTALPDVGPVPATAGVRYSEGFIQATHVRANMAHRWMIPIGTESATMFDAVWPRLFTRVVRLEDPGGVQASVDVVLEPSLESFDFFLPREQPRPGDVVVYRVNMHVPDGPMVATWTVEGRVPFRPGPADAPVTPANNSLPRIGYDEPVVVSPREGWDHAADNIDDAATKLVTTFKERSRIDEYLARRTGGGSFVLPLDGVTVRATAEDVPITVPGSKPSLVPLHILPVRVRVENGGVQALRLDAVVASLRPVGGVPAAAAGAPQVLARLDESLAQASANTAFGFGIIGTFVALSKEGEKMRALPKVRAWLESKALAPGPIEPGEGAEGFFFFVLPAKASLPDAANLSLDITDADLHGGHVNVSVSGLPPTIHDSPPASAPPPSPHAPR